LEFIKHNTLIECKYYLYVKYASFNCAGTLNKLQITSGVDNSTGLIHMARNVEHVFLTSLQKNPIRYELSHC